MGFWYENNNFYISSNRSHIEQYFTIFLAFRPYFSNIQIRPNRKDLRMNTRPYVGITDFTSFEQVTRMLEVFRRHRQSDSKRQLHIGVMMSYKTLNCIETKWSKAFPPKETIADIFGLTDDADDLYYCLHYADYDHDTKFTDLACGIEYAGPWVNAVQLDMPWPDPGVVASGVHTSRKQIEVILQVGKRSIEEADDDPAEVVRRLEDYEGVIHRVLLDKSMGRGLGMDAAGLIPFARAIKDRFPNLGLVAAGGLGPESINLVEPLAKELPDLSIDAQEKLRPSGNALDPIDWDMAGAYLAKALGLLK